MDLAVIVAVFVLGFGAARIGLPPLVGYLAAGFVLHAFGYEDDGTIAAIGEIGVLLLLFGLGLKLRPATLVRREVWATAGLHMAATTAVIGGLLLAAGALGLPLAASLDPATAALVGFAFSFSSTVFAVKALEQRNETASLSGRLAIGILVVQDVFAVVFLTLAADRAPSLWAVGVAVGLVAARPVFGWVLERVGHGELIVLLGLVMAVGVGAELFDRVGVKPDLGALVVGILLAWHPRSKELSDQILGLKDLLLVGFFLTIGLGGTPESPALVVAGIVLALGALKTAGFVGLLSRHHLRARTSLHTALTLTSYSEFGLIVMAAAVDRGFVDPQWVPAVAVAVAVSFAAGAGLNEGRYALYGRWSRWLVQLERHPIRSDDAIVEPANARIVVFGMGRVGQGAYDEFVRRLGHVVLGVDRANAAVTANVAAGRRVIRGDALDRDFWERLSLRPGIELAVLAMGDHAANLEAARRVRQYLPEIRIAAAAVYPDQVRELREVGVDVARNLYGEAGQGLADDATDLLEGRPPA